MTRTLLFDPSLPIPIIAGLAAVFFLLLVFAALRLLRGWPWRGLAALALLAALLNPSVQTDEREPLSDIALIVVDETESQSLGPRRAQSEEALGQVLAELERLGVEARVSRVSDAPDGEGGTFLYAALEDLLAETPRARIAGSFVISDGLIHDTNPSPALPAPTHLLLTGESTDWDRRLVIENAPSFAILGEEFSFTFRVEDMGAVPSNLPPQAELLVSIDGGEAQRFQVPTNETLTVPLTLPHGGRNVMQFSLPVQEGELTERNNDAVVQINGVRDRLRVLLVSGQPHPGQRTWRNLLKSDSTVDLVNFTILRPPGKQDGVPVTELSLISFPTRELFLEKVDEFDLIIFDRYKRRGILSPIYLDSVRQYVEDGGALLVAAGPDFASADSLYRSPLAEVLPLEPTARVIEEGFLPQITDTGAKHPVTEGLEIHSPLQEEDTPWGRWFRQIDLVEKARGDAQVVMSGYEDRPLLALQRVGEGRVALLGSDHVWLWDRGYEGGGPQLELLRRLAHWMMKEPELEEEALQVSAAGQEITITRQTLRDAIGPVTLTAPDGSVSTVILDEAQPGRFAATVSAEVQGLYRIAEGDLETVFALGPAAPREFEQTIASAGALQPLTDAQRGGTLRVEDGALSLRMVREGRAAAGRGWLGLTSRYAFVTTDLRIAPLLPAWALLLLALAFSLIAWLREGRR